MNDINEWTVGEVLEALADMSESLATLKAQQRDNDRRLRDLERHEVPKYVEYGDHRIHNASDWGDRQ